jgi:uncharacterized iron-regulated membrane protein
MTSINEERSALYRTVWRWHFYAGLFVIPLMIMLSITGAIYLFKPQIDRWEERAWRDLPTAGAVNADAQVEAAVASAPGASLHSYRLPESAGDAALVRVALPEGGGQRDVAVSPQGEVLGSRDPDDRISAVVSDIHGSLLLGRWGDWIVELAASWAIVLILSGLYLWWPRRVGGGRGAAGVIWPRFGLKGRTLLKDLHSVTGFWISALALVLLVTGLPWASVWGDAFKAVRAATGTMQGPQDWATRASGGNAALPAAAPVAARVSAVPPGHEHHDHDHPPVGTSDVPAIAPPPAVPLSSIVTLAAREDLAFPVMIQPPGVAGRFGAQASQNWTVRSDAQNRPLRVTIHYDPTTGREVDRETFADRHVIDRVVGYGIAWHEGQLFGWINQAIGVLTALALITVAVTGTLMWWRRRPEGVLGAPPIPAMPDGMRMRGLIVILIGLAVLLPLLALSLVAVFLLERLVLRLTVGGRRWLGLAPV